MLRKRIAFGVAVVRPLAAGLPVLGVGDEKTVTIKGKAVFTGNPAEYKPTPVEVPKDAACQPSTTIMSESVILNKNTDPVTLRNVAIWIKEGPVDVRQKTPGPSPTLSMFDCQFTPHLLVVSSLGAFGIRNDDKLKHNVHFLAKKNEDQSFSFPMKGMELAMIYENPETMEFRSKLFPWMNGWLIVHDHAFFLTTDASGDYEFTDFPPGKYVLQAWHEVFGTKTATVEVAAGETKELNFLFAPGKKKTGK